MIVRCVFLQIYFLLSLQKLLKSDSSSWFIVVNSVVTEQNTKNPIERFRDEERESMKEHTRIAYMSDPL